MLSMLHPAPSSSTWCRFSNKRASVKGIVKGHRYKGCSLLSACGKETVHGFLHIYYYNTPRIFVLSDRKGEQLDERCALVNANLKKFSI